MNPTLPHQSSSPIERPSTATKFAYGFGSVSSGLTETGFNYFLLIFYSQVIGIDARLVGLAITVSLMIDAFVDPIAGYWSDNLRSRWGRRHPFMYAAAVPVAVSYLLLWHPPLGWSAHQTFWYLLVLSVAIRIFMTFYETPSNALAPELAADYDERSSILSWRLFFGWSGGNVMTVLMFAVIFPAAATRLIHNGQFNRDAYATYGLLSAGLIFLAIVISALGTHNRIASFSAPPPKRRMTIRTIFAEMYQTLADRSFVALFAAAMLGAIATGLAASLTFYFTTYFWGFDSGQIGIIVVGVFASALLGAGIAPIASRRMGKKRGAMIIGLVAVLGAPLPIVLRLFDLLPPNGDPAVFWFVFATNTLDTALIICFQILTAAMIADLVDQSELRTGRRSEGLFFAAVTFVKKSVLGLGLIAASLILTLADFPVGARQGQVPADTLWRLGAYYVPTILALWLGMIAVLNSYRLERGDHEDNLRKLAARKAQTS
ncbi:MFS transporter [Sphingomonas sp. GB1N7]|uniref:MFS transporter n=1 Tax=Parasphingomonas caseinilytica TaxID=3096158 RepID=UPI002FC5A3B9